MRIKHDHVFVSFADTYPFYLYMPSTALYTVHRLNESNKLQCLAMIPRFPDFESNLV